MQIKKMHLPVGNIGLRINAWYMEFSLTSLTRDLKVAKQKPLPFLPMSVGKFVPICLTVPRLSSDRG